MNLTTLFLAAVVALAPAHFQQPAPAADKDLATGIQLYKERSFDKAVETLRPVVKAMPNNAEAHYYLGASLLEMDKIQEAEPELKKAQELAGFKQDIGAIPPADELKVSMARLQLKQNKLEPARALLDEAEKINPKNADVFVYRGAIRIAAKDYANATKALDQAMMLDEQNPYAHYYAGIAHANQKRPDKMIAHFQTFLKLAPNAPEAEKVKAVLKTR